MNNSTVQFRVDSKTKRDAISVFESFGLDISTGLKMYLRRVIKTKSIPFPLITENGYTPEQEEKLLAIVRRTEADYAAGRIKGYKSVKAMTRDIMKSS